jgi:hypothetical protein
VIFGGAMQKIFHFLMRIRNQMNEIILSLCVFASTCNGTEKPPKVTIVSCYSSTTSKKQRHEIMLSNGTCITLQNSLVDHNDVKVTIAEKKLPVTKK